MSPTSLESAQNSIDHSNKPARRLKFHDLPSPSEFQRRRNTVDVSGMKDFGANFHFTKMTGIPTSKLKQYRVAVRCGDKKSATSWKTPNQNELLVKETPEGMRLVMFSKLVFLIERRNLFEKPSVIGESDFFTIYELLKKRDSHFPKPFVVELKSEKGSQPMSLELNLRLYPVHFKDKPDQLPDGESRAKIVFEHYPEMVFKAIKALDNFVPTITYPSKQASYVILSEFVHQMGNYIRSHSRRETSYALEDNAWVFLRETTKFMTTYQNTRAKSFGQLAYLANRILRGFWLLLQLHQPERSGLETQQLKFIENELRRIGHSFTLKPSPDPPKIVPLSTQDPQLCRLKGTEMTFPSFQGQGVETISHHNAIFHEIAQWMVNHEAEHSVFWLHGKFAAGATKNQAVATFLEASKVIGFPVAYYSFVQGRDGRQSDQFSNLINMLNSMIYQLSLFDSKLADAFHPFIEGEAFGSQDYRARFQLLLYALFSLSYAEQARLSPILLLIDDLEPSNSGSPSPEYNHLLQVLHAASVATHLASSTSSRVLPSPDSSFSPDSSSSAISKTQGVSLPFPPFLRIIVLSRSLGVNPALIEQFAYIRDIHRLVDVRNGNDKAAKFYNCAVNGPNHKGKGRQKAHSPEVSSLIPIAEANSQASGDYPGCRALPI